MHYYRVRLKEKLHMKWDDMHTNLTDMKQNEIRKLYQGWRMGLLWLFCFVHIITSQNIQINKLLQSHAKRKIAHEMRQYAQ